MKSPHRHRVRKNEEVKIKISNTFRNGPSCIISAKKKQQVIIADSSDDSDVDIFPGENNPHGKSVEEKTDTAISK